MVQVQSETSVRRVLPKHAGVQVACHQAIPLWTQRWVYIEQELAAPGKEIVSVWAIRCGPNPSRGGRSYHFFCVDLSWHPTHHTQTPCPFRDVAAYVDRLPEMPTFDVARSVLVLAVPLGCL